MHLTMLNLEKRRIRVTRKSTKSNAGARLVEFNRAATEVASKLYLRAICRLAWFGYYTHISNRVARTAVETARQL